MPEMTRERLAEIKRYFEPKLIALADWERFVALLAAAKAALDVADELDATEELQTCMPNHAKMWADRLRGKA